MVDCIFCKIIAKQIPSDTIYQDDHVVVFRDIHPKATVHLLMVPKNHIENLFFLENTHVDLISHMLLLLPKLAKSEGLAHGFRTVINTGRGGGQEVDHLHFHLLGNSHLPGF